jgi:hypothetical protein
MIIFVPFFVAFFCILWATYQMFKLVAVTIAVLFKEIFNRNH